MIRYSPLLAALSIPFGGLSMILPLLLRKKLGKLLTGSYADYQGAIRYDGVELHKIDPEGLRKLVTVIHQNTFTFNDHEASDPADRDPQNQGRAYPAV